MDTHEASATFTDTSNSIAEERKVVLSVGSNDPLRGYWKLDETGDETVATDQSVFKNDGTLSGGSWINGHYGGALAFNGSNDLVSCSSVPMQGQMTLSAWINPSSFDGDRGIIGSEGSFAMKTTSTGELRFTTPGIRDHNSSGANLVLDSWQHVAITFDANQANGMGFYVNGSQVSRVNASGFDAGSGNFKIGANQWDQYFHGAIDDVRIYNKILSASELQDIYEGGGAECPNPYNLQTNAHVDWIQWKPGATATNHHVYVGTNQAAVASATPTSPEFKEMTPESLFAVNLEPSAQYYWRIDSIIPSGIVVGPVWIFSTATLLPTQDLFKYSFPASYTGAGDTMVDLSAAGNNTTLTGPGGIKNDRPAGFDSALISLSGNGGGHGTTDAIDLLNNTDVAANGGFTMDVWFKWGGTYTDTRKLIDYAGTECLRTRDSKIQFGLSNGATLLSHDIVADQWYHAVAVFDATGKSAVEDPAHPGEYTVNGNAKLYIDDVLVASVPDVAKSSYGDRLNRAIGINMHPKGSEWNQGMIFNPSVYLGASADTDGDGIPDVSDPDDDNDGIPDDWENDHGLNPLVDDASGHSDPDPYDNWFEYVSDTDPMDGDSWQTFSFEIDPGTGDPTARFSTSASRRYTVRYRTNLIDGVWQDLGAPFPGTGSEMAVPDPADGNQRYYRLRIELP